MKWWIKGLIASVLWIALCFAGAYLFFPAQTAPEQDARLSELLGEICGSGLVLVGVWLLVARFSSKLPNKNQ